MAVQDLREPMISISMVVQVYTLKQSTTHYRVAYVQGEYWIGLCFCEYCNRQYWIGLYFVSIVIII